MAKDAADEVTSNLSRFPTPAEFLKFALELRSRYASVEAQKRDNEAKDFFKPSKYSAEIPRDSVKAVNEIMAIKPGDFKAHCETVYRVAKQMLEKYADKDDLFKRPFLEMIREAKEGFKKTLDKNSA